MRDGQCDFVRNIVPNRVREDDLIHKDGHACVMSRSNLPRGQQAMSERYHEEWSEHRWLSIQAPGRLGLLQLIAPRDQLSQGRPWSEIQLKQMRLHGYLGDDVRDYALWVDPGAYVVPALIDRHHVRAVSVEHLVREGDEIITDIMTWFGRTIRANRWDLWLTQWRLWSSSLQPHVEWLRNPRPRGLPVYDHCERWLCENQSIDSKITSQGI